MTKLQKYQIYNLLFSFAEIIPYLQEIDFRGSLSYQINDLDKFIEITFGELSQERVDILLNHILSAYIRTILESIDKDDLVNKRPIIVNRLEVIIRREFAKIGLEFVNFKEVDLWCFNSLPEAVIFSDM